MTDQKLIVDAVAITGEAVNLDEVETMEESFAAGSSNSGGSN